MIALDAEAALSTSFALSVLATLGIVVFGGLANSWLKACLGWLPAFVREALGFNQLLCHKCKSLITKV